MPPSSDAINLQDALDGLGHAILIFDLEGDLIQYNRAAGRRIGADLKLLQDMGWNAAETLFKPYEPNKNTPRTLSDVRKEANKSGKPIRFQILTNGIYTPCWASAVPGPKGAMMTLITIDSPDWTALTELVDTFRKEVNETVAATRGHIDIINNSMGLVKPTDPVENLTKRIGGFNRLIDMQMFRTAELLRMMERMEDLRTGKLEDIYHETRRKIKLDYWLEDFIEELEHTDLLDPETEHHDYRSRIQTELESKLVIQASSLLLTRILRDVVRNAIMYSMKATPITIEAKKQGDYINIDIIDEGYGVREKERDRVFTPFQRARQPQIISEFGYGLSLYLCKHEVEIMNGAMWFDSEEKVGSTFSIKLPIWRDISSKS